MSAASFVMKQSVLCIFKTKTVGHNLKTLLHARYFSNFCTKTPAVSLTTVRWDNSRFIHNTTRSWGIQDNISSLQLKKRAVRKRKPLEEDVEKPPGLYDTVAFSTAEEYNLEELVKGLKSQDLYEPQTFENNPDVVYASAKIQVGSEPREIFFFREGSVVLWNVTDLESSNVLAFLKKYEIDRYSEKLVQNEAEIMNYKHQEPK